MSGSFATLNSLDQLNGGLGTDSINIELNGISAVPTSLASIELINVSSTTGTSTLDLVNAPAVTAINSSASAGALTLNNIKTTAATVTIASSSAVHTIDYANSVVTGSTDTARVSLSNFAATANGTEDLVIDSGIETLALNVSGTNSADSAFAGAMTVTGSGTLTLTAGTGGSASSLVLANSVDASAMTGALTMAMSNAAHTVSGGADNDSLTGATAAANTLTGNAGNDTLVGGSGNDVLSGGDGNDRLTAAAGNDSIDGGAGNDTFVMGANLISSDSIAGGDGTDTGTATGTVLDAAFTNVTTVETLKSAGSTFVATLGALATAAGVTTVDLSNAGQDLVTFDTGYTGSATVNITGDSVGNTDQVVNTANATLNVVGNASDLDAGTTVTGGTGTDTLTLTADNDVTGADTSGITGLENITVAANATTASSDIVISMGTSDTQIDAGKTLTVSAAALTDSGATLTFNGTTSETDGFLNITGGAGNDTISGGNSDDVIDGGAGADSITANDGSDSLVGGAGNDTFIMDANLTAGDTLAGGDGSDTVSATGTVADAAFASITTVETLKSAGSTFVATLGALATAAGVTTVDMSSEGQDQVTFATGYTGSATVKITGDSAGNTDQVINTANATLNVVGNASDLDAGTTVTGGTGTDTITLTADNDVTGADTSGITGVEIITVAANATTASNDIVISMDGDGQIAAGKTLTVNATALTNSGATLTFNGTASETNGFLNITGGAGNDTISGGNSNDVLSGGAGADSITAFAGNDNLSGGAGNDTFAMGGNFNFDDTIAGGDGTDTISASGVVQDIAFLGVTAVETLQSSDPGSPLDVSLGARAVAAGIVTVDASSIGDDVVTFASGYTGSATVRLTGNSTNADKVINAANITLNVVGNASDLDATTTITGGTGTDTITLTADNDGTGATTTLMTGIENITVAANATTATNDSVIAMGDNNLQIAAGKTLTVSAAALTNTGATLTFTGTASETDGFLSITGGAGADTLTGGGSNDTISGGGGADVLEGGAGKDQISGGAGADTIADYVVANDSIQLSIGTFSALGVIGDLTVAEFESGAAATVSTTRIVYNETSGELFYDADGSGADVAVLIGTFTGGPALVLGEFKIVA